MIYTMEMITDRLNRALITDFEIVGEDWITSVRFSHSESLRNDLLFLSAVPDKEETLCRTARGSHFLYRTAPQKLLNEILEIMEYYDTWEAGLQQMIQGGCTLTELLDLAYPVIPFPMFILNNAEWLIASSSNLHNYNIQNIPTLSDLMRDRTSSPELLGSFNQAYYQYFQLKSVYKIPGDIFTDNGYAINLFRENDFCGILLMEGFDAEISRGTLDLFSLFSWKIQNMLNDPSSNISIEIKEISLLDYLKDPNEETLRKYLHDLHIAGWKDSDEKQLLYLRPSDDSILSPNINHAILIFNRLNTLKVAEYKDGILLLLNRSLRQDHSGYKQIRDRIRQLSYCAGSSDIFRDPSLLPLMFSRASAALSAGDKSPGAVNAFDDYFMDYFFSIIKKEDKDVLEHPILRQFESYDKRYGSSLLDTLFVYLQNERRITDTANEMSLSRNTLVHRLQRIEELSGGILSDPWTRLRILLSFYLR